jgi:hypothetical protein
MLTLFDKILEKVIIHNMNGLSNHFIEWWDYFVEIVLFDFSSDF